VPSSPKRGSAFPAKKAPRLISVRVGATARTGGSGSTPCQPSRRQAIGPHRRALDSRVSTWTAAAWLIPSMSTTSNRRRSPTLEKRDEHLLAEVLDRRRRARRLAGLEPAYVGLGERAMVVSLGARCVEPRGCAPQRATPRLRTSQAAELLAGPLHVAALLRVAPREVDSRLPAGPRRHACLAVRQPQRDTSDVAARAPVVVGREGGCRGRAPRERPQRLNDGRGPL
jgi:hypothetical protein